MVRSVRTIWLDPQRAGKSSLPLERRTILSKKVISTHGNSNARNRFHEEQAGWFPFCLACCRCPAAPVASSPLPGPHPIGPTTVTTSNNLKMLLLWLDLTVFQSVFQFRGFPCL